MNFLYLTQLLFLLNKERKAWDFKHEEIDPDLVSKILLLFLPSPDIHFTVGIKIWQNPYGLQVLTLQPSPEEEVIQYKYRGTTQRV